ncbi:heat-inducible transcription repressor HrcA [Malonomonas rubra DSM 5091]|uniref:Heat-inducible transcription repressor HrcA n=1 Tax=Malonomonas rubra DSM 5091 TaxID=1122189 RepID=A0A1M6HB17_MALRU|nr:heat-inducible transcriptional repressor HrcA [Malonomonas rubra]SHJ19346.1 heat-inducible transcription repressor HrcA [Malonomonas rubra DSM 5091]
MAEELNERSQNILEAIVEDYIASAEPVGSRAITKRHSFNLSPASVRNVMSDLEDMGFLCSPHTSAGRIPTEKGFHYYIDSLLKVRHLSKDEERKLLKSYRFQGMKMEDVMQEVGRVMSGLSNYTGLVMAPKFASTVFRQIEFIRLSHGRLLVIYVSETGLVQNKVIECPDDLSQRELEQINNYLNHELTGLNIHDVREKISSELKDERSRFDQLRRQALSLSSKALQEEADDLVYVSGTSLMLEQPEFSTPEKMKRIIQALESKKTLIDLLDRGQAAAGVQIFIGSQSQLTELEGCSLVTSTFSNQKGAIGTLGVIGPMRMSYSQVIPIVDFTAQMVSRILEREIE